MKNTKTETKRSKRIEKAAELSKVFNAVVEYSTPAENHAENEKAVKEAVNSIGADLQTGSATIIPTASNTSDTVSESSKVKTVAKNEHPLAIADFDAYEALTEKKVDSLKKSIDLYQKGGTGIIGLETINKKLNGLHADLEILKNDKKSTTPQIETAQVAYEEYSKFRDNYVLKCKAEFSEALKLANKDLQHKFYQMFDKFSAVQIIEIYSGCTYEAAEAPEKTRKNAINALCFNQISGVPDNNLNCEITVNRAPATLKGLQQYRFEIAKAEAEAKGDDFGKDQKTEITNGLIPSASRQFLRLYKIAAASLFKYDGTKLSETAKSDIDSYKIENETIFKNASKTASEKQIQALAKSLLLDNAPTESEIEAYTNKYHFKRNNGYALYFEAYKKIRGAFKIVDDLTLIDAFIIEARYSQKGLYTPVLNADDILKTTTKKA